MDVLRIVIFRPHADRQPFTAGDDVEMLRHRPQCLLVDHRVVAQCPQIPRDAEDRGQRCVVGQRGNGGVDDADAELDRLQRAQRTEARRAMRMHLDRDAGAIGEHGGDERAHAIRRQQPARVLQADPIGRERDSGTDALREIRIGVSRRDRIGNVDDGVDTGASCSAGAKGPHRGIVPGVRDPGLANAGRAHQVPEQLVHHRLLETEQVEAAGIRAQSRARHPPRDQPDALEGILAQLANAFAQERGGQQLDRVEPRGRDAAGDREHHPRGHALCPQALMTIAQCGVDERDLVHGRLP